MFATATTDHRRFFVVQNLAHYLKVDVPLRNNKEGAKRRRPISFQILSLGGFPAL
jgi:hypothetical protein